MLQRDDDDSEQQQWQRSRRRKARMKSRKSKLPIQRRRAGAETVKIEKEKLTGAAAATKVRTRIRKPRYVSLTKLDRKEEDDDNDMEMKLIDLFPIRTAAAAVPAAAVEEHVSVSVSRISEYFFSEECDSLTGLLDSEEAISMSVEVSPMFEGVDRNEKLVKAALRSRDRDESKEKWVSYSEVVEDVSSSAVDGYGRKDDEEVMKLKRLSLKLDYQEVLDAWDGGRSLFVGGIECAQIVPCFDDDDLFAGDSNGAWCVPDQTAKKKMIKNEEFMMNMEDDDDDDEQKWKKTVQMREASLQRYKEKRRNRLFSKRIRYEVRKLNAEKRPRIKGRFVKRD